MFTESVDMVNAKVFETGIRRQAGWRLDAPPGSVDWYRLVVLNGT